MAREINLFEQQDLFIAKEEKGEPLIQPVGKSPEMAPLSQTHPPQNDAPASKSASLLTDDQLSSVMENINKDKAQKKEERLSRSKIKQIIEALLFASNEPLPLHKIREVTDTVHPLKPRILQDLLQELQHEYMEQQRAFHLVEIAQGFMVRTRHEFSNFIDLLYRNKRTEKLSQAGMEVLAIIAYRQPVTRPQVEAIRGVDSSGIIQRLLDRQLIEATGRMDGPGRPTLYGCTKDFLKHFGLRDLKDLPQVK